MVSKCINKFNDKFSSDMSFLLGDMLKYDNVLWHLDNKILFDDKEIVLAILDDITNRDIIYMLNDVHDDSEHYYNTYMKFSNRLRCDRNVCYEVLESKPDYFQYIDDKIKNDIIFITSLTDSTINSIYCELPDHIKNNNMISSFYDSNKTPSFNRKSVKKSVVY
jgi:hypothetical protein